MTALTAIVFTRYIILPAENRKEADIRTQGLYNFIYVRSLTTKYNYKHIHLYKLYLVISY